MGKTKQDLRTLEELLEFIPENHKPIAKELLLRLKFMKTTLNKLQTQIRKEGAVIEAVNGNGFKTKTEHPAQKSYNTMIGRYNALVKTFTELVPEGEGAEDPFLEFVSGGKK